MNKEIEKNVENCRKLVKFEKYYEAKCSLLLA